MTRLTQFTGALVLAMPLIAGHAADDAPFDPVVVKSAMLLSTYDRLDAECRKSGSMSAGQATKVEKWRAEHAPDRVRARLAAMHMSASMRQQIEAAANTIVAQVREKKADPCFAVTALLQTPEAKFRQSAPALLAGTAAGSIGPSDSGADRAGAADGATTPPAPRPEASATDAAPAATPKAADAATTSGQDPGGQAQRIQALLAQIDSFAFATRPKMGVGGFIALDIYPVVLLRSGEALDDVEGLMFPGGLDAHKRAHPDDWTRWRRSGGKLEWQTKKGWEAMPFQKTYASLPDGFRLDGLYRYLSGTGTVAVGGTQSVTAFNQYQFFSDGRVIRGGGVGSTGSTAPGASDTGGTSVATRSVAPNRRGQYRIDRLVLDIRYDDGSSEQRILITDPNDPKSVIWLDGVGYVRRKG